MRNTIRDDQYGRIQIYLHDYRDLIRSAAKLRGQTVSAYIRNVVGENARIEVNQKSVRIDSGNQND